MNPAAKEQFLKERFILLLRQLPSDTPPHWGKMTLQQMIEHFSDSVRIASGKMIFTETIFGEEQVEKLRSFLQSDKPFRENTVNPLLSEVPAPVKNTSVDEAIKELQKELNYFFTAFEKNKSGVTRSPFYGDLNYEENIQLLYKHALHHLKQFGINM